MTTAVVWMLIMFSGGTYNYGNFSTKDFATKESCLFAREQIMNLSSYTDKAQCIKVEIPVAK